MRLSLILMVILIVMGGIGYWYYTDTQGKISILTSNNAKLETAISVQEETITALNKNAENMKIEYEKLNKSYAEIRRQNDRLSDKLSDVDLGLLAEEKPQLMETVVNRGTRNANRCFEILSGSPLTKDEKDAISAEKFNPECPWLWPGTPNVVQPEHSETN